MFINQDLMVDNLLARSAFIGGPPVTLEIAREYGCCFGCLEPQLAGMESGWGAGTDGIRPGRRADIVTGALELVLTNGWSRIAQAKQGLETGDPRDFKSFEEVRDAYTKQVARQIRNYCISQNVGELAGLQPTLFASALTEDCIENGVTKEHGGAPVHLIHPMYRIHHRPARAFAGQDRPVSPALLPAGHRRRNAHAGRGAGLARRVYRQDGKPHARRHHRGDRWTGIGCIERALLPAVGRLRTAQPDCE